MGLVVSFEFTLFSGLLQFLVSGCKDGLLFASKFVRRGDVTDGTVESDLVVVVHELCNDPLGILQTQRRARSNAVRFEGLMPSLDLAVALWVIRGSPDVGQSCYSDEFLEVTSDELRPVVRNDPWPC